MRLFSVQIDHGQLRRQQSSADPVKTSGLVTVVTFKKAQPRPDLLEEHGVPRVFVEIDLFCALCKIYEGSAAWPPPGGSMPLKQIWI